MSVYSASAKPAMEDKTKANLLLTLRLIYFLSCGCIFVYLSRGLYQNFVESKVILTASDLAIGRKDLPVPVMSICSTDPFKNHTKSMFTLKEYMENSVNVTNSTLIDYSLLKYEGDSVIYHVRIGYCITSSTNLKFDKLINKLFSGKGDIP